MSKEVRNCSPRLREALVGGARPQLQSGCRGFFWFVFFSAISFCLFLNLSIFRRHFNVENILIFLLNDQPMYSFNNAFFVAFFVHRAKLC